MSRRAAKPSCVESRSTAASGITEVAFSSDGGPTWKPGRLGPDHGRYSFHEWSAAFTPGRKGPYRLQAARRRTRLERRSRCSRSGIPAGYMRNVVETVSVVAV